MKMQRISRIVAAGALLSAFTAAIPAGSAVKIMLIGDSITQGEGYCFRYHLWNKLLDSGYTSIDFVGTSTWGYYHGDFDEDHESWGGKNSQEILDMSRSDIASIGPDIAVIHAGTNDCFQVKPVSTPRANIASIITNLRSANPNVKIALVTFTMRSQYLSCARQLASELEQLAGQLNTVQSPVITVDCASDMSYDDYRDSYDTSHPNNRGNVKISDRLYDALVPWLPRSAPRVRTFPREGPNLSAAAGVNPTASRELKTAAELAVDGDLLTSWQAVPFTQGSPLPSAPDDWLELDLAEAHDLKGSSICWEVNGRKYGYLIETRTLPSDPWTRAVDQRQNQDWAECFHGQVDYFNAPETRYVRVTVTGLDNASSWTQWPAGIAEFRVFDSLYDETAARLRCGRAVPGRLLCITDNSSAPQQSFRVTLLGRRIPPLFHALGGAGCTLSAGAANGRAVMQLGGRGTLTEKKHGPRRQSGR